MSSILLNLYIIWSCLTALYISLYMRLTSIGIPKCLTSLWHVMVISYFPLILIHFNFSFHLKYFKNMDGFAYLQTNQLVLLCIGLAVYQTFNINHLSYTKTLVPIYRFRPNTFFFYCVAICFWKNILFSPKFKKTLSWAVFWRSLDCSSSISRYMFGHIWGLY